MVGLFSIFRGARLGRASRSGARRRPTARPAALEALEGRALMSAGLGFRSHREFHRLERVPRVDRSSLGEGRNGPSRGMNGVVYTRDGSALDVYRPSGPTPQGGWPVIVAIPGGGWRWVDKSSYATAVSGAFVKNGYIVVAIDYAYNSPGGPPSWPANIEDVRAAIQWVRTNADRIGADPDRIVAMGESAGGHLAELAGVLPDGPVQVEGANLAVSQSAPGEVSSRVQAVVAFYGPSDLFDEYRDEPEGRSYLTSFLGGTPDRVTGRYEAASPISHVTPDDPPMYLVQGTADQIVAPGQSIELADALRRAGVPVELTLLEGQTHGFRFKGRTIDLRPGILAFLDAALNRPATPA